MSFETRLAERKDELAEKWGDLILATYPGETQAIWKGQKNKFANPVGNAIDNSVTGLFDLILEWDDAEKVRRELDYLVKIRAVQNFKPSKALSFVFLLKKLLRAEFMEELKKEDKLEELMLFEARIDNLALIAFDQYDEAKQTIYQSRVKEVKNAQYNLLRRANMIVDSTATGADKS
ncbi:MAG: RsbRD N-terminal domain-containing protein [Proteobacteria bacterium]|nr:RsbRD N-terminal domain-containing protein [Pseudomonadota bacterium]MBU1611380.1 RsbRD N-terminal domain-containing protein [Pseudomonadota bacterium]